MFSAHGGDRLRLMAVSGADDLDRRGAAVEALEAAMEECAAQDIEVVYPPPLEAEADPAQRRVTRAHQELSRKFGPAAMLSLPLRVEGDLAGVVLLEREAADPFPPGAAALMRLVAEFIGPAVWTRRLADRKVLAVARDRVLELGQAAVGPRHTGAKLLGLLVLLVFIGLAAIPIPDRVSAKAEIKAQLSRTIVPPFTGYLKEVRVRAGDAVEAEQVLAAMDDTELNLQLARYSADKQTQSTQRDDAQSKGDLSKARELEGEIQQTQASIDETQAKLQRSVIRSPIAGVVSKGDLDPFIGARIDPSQPLLEVVGTDRLVTVQIPERDIGRVMARLEEDKQVTGHLVTKALPDRKIPITIASVNPAAEVVDGANVYLAEAMITADDPGAPPPGTWLKPGMTGTAKLHDGYTTGLGAILRPVVDELRLRLWF
jgi:multidrug efflux pump subunit AcrA (membrane-fusion protein)